MFTILCASGERLFCGECGPPFQRVHRPMNTSPLGASAQFAERHLFCCKFLSRPHGVLTGFVWSNVLVRREVVGWK